MKENILPIISILLSIINLGILIYFIKNKKVNIQDITTEEVDGYYIFRDKNKIIINVVKK
jgi:hypothetical protein